MSSKGKKKKTWKIVTWLIVFILIAGLAGRFAMRRRAVDQKEVTPMKNDITTYYSFNGSVEAENKETIFSDKAMQIKEIKVEKGQIVEEDEVLMITTANQKIKAKMSGEISNIYAEENAQLMPGSKLLDIVDYDNLQIKVQVDEYDLAAVTEGKEAIITINALDKDIKGTIAEVSKEGTYSNGITFFMATISLEKDNALKIGMSAEAKILNKSALNVITLPMSAIKFDDNNMPYVLVKDEKLSKQVEVELGITDGVIVEIKRGIAESDIILVQKDTDIEFRPMGMRENNSSGGTNGGN